MANFKRSYEILKRLEFSDESNALHKNENENGLTWMGIYEAKNPSWANWSEIKRTARAFGDLKSASVALFKDPILQADTAKFYKMKYWDKMLGDEIISQKIADEIFIFGVNVGIARAIKEAQKIVGANSDGVFGEQTLRAINSYDESKFDKEFDEIEIRYYEELIKANPSFRVYARGWKSRARAL